MSTSRFHRKPGAGSFKNSELVLGHNKTAAFALRSRSRRIKTVKSAINRSPRFLKTEVFGQALSQADCEVILAEDGFDALQKISVHQPDLIFADVLMPRLNGYQTCALIKRSGICSHIPVVMLTSKDTLFDRTRGFAVGSNQHLTKPFTKETLLRGLETLVPLKCAAA